MQAHLVELLPTDVAFFEQSVVVLLEKILESVIHQHWLSSKVDVRRHACLRMVS